MPELKQAAVAVAALALPEVEGKKCSRNDVVNVIAGFGAAPG